MNFKTMLILFIASFISCQVTHRRMLPVYISPETLIANRVVEAPGKFWLYFAVSSKASPSSAKNRGLHKKNDLVEALPVTPQFIPTLREQSVYRIIKVTNTTLSELTKFRQEWRDSVGIEEERELIANRLYVFNKKGDPFIAGIDTTTIDFSTIKNDFQIKTPAQLKSYIWDVYKERANYPFIKLFNWINKPLYAAETISTCNKAGETFNTVTLFESTQNGDITAGNAEVLEVYDDQGILVESSFSFGGWTTDADSYISVRAATGEETTGTMDNGFTWEFQGTGAFFTVANGACFFRLKGINIKETDVSATDTRNVRINCSDASSVVTLDRLLIEMNTPSANSRGIGIIDNANITISNTAIYNTGGAVNGHGIYSLSNITAVVDLINTTVDSMTDGYERDNGTFTTKNSIATECLDGFDGTMTKTTSASDIASDANIDLTQANSALYTNAGAGDYSIKDASSELHDSQNTWTAGATSEDLIGTSRPQGDAIDGGGFEFIEAVTRRIFLIGMLDEKRRN